MIFINFVFSFIFFAINIFAATETELGGLEVSRVPMGYGDVIMPSARLGYYMTFFLGTFFLGIIFFGMMLYGGFLWMTSQGNEEQTTKAKNIIKNASIGLIIAVSAWAITLLIKNIIY